MSAEDMEVSTDVQSDNGQQFGDFLSLMPRTFEGAQQFCDILAKSDLVPQAYHGKPANIFVAIQCGAEIGLSPMQAVQSMAVISGRPCLYGDAPLGLVQASQKMEWIKEWAEGDTAYCETKRRGYPASHKSSFSQADAVKMGLAGKAGPWTQLPARMRQLRARAFNLRDQYADVLKGVAIKEEIIDITPPDESPIPEPPPPTTQEEKGAQVRERMDKARTKASPVASTADFDAAMSKQVDLRLANKETDTP